MIAVEYLNPDEAFARLREECGFPVSFRGMYRICLEAMERYDECRAVGKVAISTESGIGVGSNLHMPHLVRQARPISP
jgi:hypothetical protein